MYNIDFSIWHETIFFTVFSSMSQNLVVQSSKEPDFYPNEKQKNSQFFAILLRSFFFISFAKRGKKIYLEIKWNKVYRIILKIRSEIFEVSTKLLYGKKNYCVYFERFSKNFSSNCQISKIIITKARKCEIHLSS